MFTRNGGGDEDITLEMKVKRRCSLMEVGEKEKAKTYLYGSVG